MTDPLWIDASAGTPAYSSAELRRLMAVAHIYNGRVLGARQGVRPGGTGLDTTLVGSTITVKTGTAIVDPALTTTQGPYWVVIAADETFTLTAAHATLARKDITILRVYDNTEDSSGLRKAQTEYLVGTPAGSPAEPSVPAGAIKLATIDVPPSGGGSPVVTINKAFTVASGGVLPVRDSTERGLITPYDGMVIYRMDRDWKEIYDGAAWRVQQNPAVCSSTSDRDAAITSPYNGQMAYTSDTGTLWQRHSGAWREFPAQPRAELRQTVAQALTNGGFTTITFNAEDRDSHNAHDTVTNNSRFVVPVAGDYLVGGAVNFASSTGFKATRWLKTGNPVAGSQMDANSTAGAEFPVMARPKIISCAVNDYIELQGYQEAGSLNTGVGSDVQSSMTVARIGA